jgi:short-subunit dehydrogenase
MQHILITGASSGLGAALALAYAKPNVTLILTGRNAERLGDVDASCQTRGTKVIAQVIDVCNKAAMAELVNKYPIDIAIANAGISAGTAGGTESPEQTAAIFATNVQGVLNTLEPLIPQMQQRGSGQIALLSSLASFKGFPSAPAYCASKAAVRFIGEAWRPFLKQSGVKVSVICPGFIETPMTAVNNFPMPFLLSPEKAAKIIIRGLEQNKARIAFPLPLYFTSWLIGILPPAWLDWFMQKLPKK